MNVGMVVWAGLTFFIWGTAYTVSDIPLWGVIPLLTEDDNQRNKILSIARIVGGAGGGIVMFSLQPIAYFLRDVLEPSMGHVAAARYGFLIAVAIFAVVGGALFQICGFVIKEKVTGTDKKPTLKENLKIMWRNKPFRRIFLSGILGSPRMLIMVVAMPIVSYYFASRDALLAMVYIAILGGSLFVGQFLCMAFAPKLVKRFSKRKLYNFSHIMMIPPFLLFFVLYLLAPMPAGLTHPGFVALCALLFAFCGAGFGLTTVMQSFMIADAIDYEEYHYGHRPDGVFFSGQTFIAKLSASIAALLSTAGFWIVGFSDAGVQRINEYMANGGIPRENPEFQSYMFILFFLVAVPPAVGCILGVLPTLKYELDNDEFDRITIEIQKRRAAKDTTAEETTETLTEVNVE